MWSVSFMRNSLRLETVSKVRVLSQSIQHVSSLPVPQFSPSTTTVLNYGKLIASLMGSLLTIETSSKFPPGSSCMCPACWHILQWPTCWCVMVFGIFFQYHFHALTEYVLHWCDTRLVHCWLQIQISAWVWSSTYTMTSPERRGLKCGSADSVPL